MRTRTFRLGTSLGYQINGVGRALAARLTEALRPCDLTTSQWGILQDVSEHPGTSQRDISERTGMDAATLAEVARRMEGRGLITREPDRADARRRVVALTDRAKGLLPAARQAALGVNARAVDGLSDEDRERLTELLNRVWENLR